MQFFFVLSLSLPCSNIITTVFIVEVPKGTTLYIWLCNFGFGCYFQIGELKCKPGVLLQSRRRAIESLTVSGKWKQIYYELCCSSWRLSLSGAVEFVLFVSSAQDKGKREESSIPHPDGYEPRFWYCTVLSLWSLDFHVQSTEPMQGTNHVIKSIFRPQKKKNSQYGADDLELDTRIVEKNAWMEFIMMDFSRDQKTSVSL